MSGLSAAARNVFDSRSRLQVALNKTGANVESRYWLLQGLFYFVKPGFFYQTVSLPHLTAATKTDKMGCAK